MDQGRYGQVQLSAQELEEYRRMASYAVHCLRPRVGMQAVDGQGLTGDDWVQIAWLRAVNAAQAFHAQTQGTGPASQRTTWVRTAIWNTMRDQIRKHRIRARAVVTNSRLAEIHTPPTDQTPETTAIHRQQLRAVVDTGVNVDLLLTPRRELPMKEIARAMRLRWQLRDRFPDFAR